MSERKETYAETAFRAFNGHMKPEDAQLYAESKRVQEAWERVASSVRLKTINEVKELLEGFLRSKVAK